MLKGIQLKCVGVKIPYVIEIIIYYLLKCSTDSSITNNFNIITQGLTLKSKFKEKLIFLLKTLLIALC